jgi:hypothetical protein
MWRRVLPSDAPSDARASTHVRLIGTLFVVWGVLTTIIGLSTLALAVGAATIIAAEGQSGGQLAAGLVAAFFTTVGVLAILWGSIHVVVGVPLGRRRAWARLAALTLGAADLALLPYGTGLGVYALWVLLGERRKALFT